MEPPAGTTNIDEVNERLSDGLKTCRSVVANYKALLWPEQNVVPHLQAANDDTGDPGAASEEDLS